MFSIQKKKKNKQNNRNPSHNTKLISHADNRHAAAAAATYTQPGDCRWSARQAAAQRVAVRRSFIHSCIYIHTYILYINTAWFCHVASLVLTLVVELLQRRFCCCYWPTSHFKLKLSIIWIGRSNCYKFGAGICIWRHAHTHTLKWICACNIR